MANLHSLESEFIAAPWHLRLENIMQNRSQLGISWAHIAVLSYLISASQVKTLLRYNARTISEKINIHEKTAYSTIQALRELDYVRVIDYKGCTYYIVNPLLANRGAMKQRAFKVKLWNQAIQYKRQRAIHAIEIGHSSQSENAIHDNGHSS